MEESEHIDVGDELSYITYAESAIFHLQDIWRKKEGMEWEVLLEICERLEDQIYRTALRECAPVAQDSIWLKKEAINWYEDKWRLIIKCLKTRDWPWKQVFDDNKGNARSLYTALLSEDFKLKKKQRVSEPKPRKPPLADPTGSVSADPMGKKTRKPGVPRGKAAKSSTGQLTAALSSSISTAVFPKPSSTLSMSLPWGIAESKGFEDLPQMDDDFLMLDMDGDEEKLELDEARWRAGQQQSAATTSSGSSSGYQHYSTAGGQLEQGPGTTALEQARAEMARKEYQQAALTQLHQSVEASRQRDLRQSLEDVAAAVGQPTAISAEQERLLEEERERERQKRESETQTLVIDNYDLHDMFLG